MKTIEERAKEYADNFVVGDSAIIADLLHKVAEESYIKGATEQRPIDDAELAEVKRQRDAYYDELLKLRRQKVEIIDKVCEWLKNEFEGGNYVQDWQLEDFRKAMEE